MTQPWSTLVAVAVGLSIVWVALLIALAAARPETISVTDALRSVARRAGPDALDKHWPGTPEGLHAVRRLTGIPTPPET